MPDATQDAAWTAAGSWSGPGEALGERAGDPLAAWRSFSGRPRSAGPSGGVRSLRGSPSPRTGDRAQAGRLLRPLRPARRQRRRRPSAATSRPGRRGVHRRPPRRGGPQGRGIPACRARLVWVISPQNRTAQVWRADGSCAAVREDGGARRRGCPARLPRGAMHSALPRKPTAATPANPSPARPPGKDREGLAAAIVADPDDDFPRLAYADWCEDGGDPEYAEFLRSPVPRPSPPLPWDDPQRPALPPARAGAASGRGAAGPGHARQQGHVRAASPTPTSRPSSF